jgi:uncharacterized lipoprotein YajG
MTTMKKLFAACAALMMLAGCATSETVATTTTAVATTTTVAPEPLDIDVIVGENSGDERIEVVALGDDVRITLVNPTQEDEYHLHGYDIVSKKMAPGAPATLTFTANVAGTFELESHVTNDVLVVLEIS